MYRSTASAVLLMLLSACTARPLDNEDGASTTSPESESAATDEQDPSTETSPATTESGDGDGDGDGDGGDGDGDEECVAPRKLDLPSDEEPDMPTSCTVEPIAWPTPEQYPGCTLCQGDSCWHEAYLGCVELEPGQTCAQLCPSGDCLGAYWNSCEGEGPMGWNSETPADTCGHYEIDGRCCTIGKFLEYCAE